MARIHKVVAYIVDPNEEYDKCRIEGVLENYLDANHIEVESSEDFEWDDDLPINKVDCSVEEYKKYLNYEPIPKKYLNYKPIPCDSYKTMTKLEKAKSIIKEHYNSGNCGIYDCRGNMFDAMANIYKDKDIQIDICYHYGYFEVFGLNKTEFRELEKYYDSLK